MQRQFYTIDEAMYVIAEYVSDNIKISEYPVCYDREHDRLKSVKVDTCIEHYTTIRPEGFRVVVKLVDRKTHEAVLAIGETLNILTDKDEKLIDATELHKTLEKINNVIQETIEKSINAIIRTPVECEP